LEEDPRDSVAPVNFYKNANDAEVALAGAYAGLSNGNGYYNRYWMNASTHASNVAYTRLSVTGDRGVIVHMNDAGMISNARYVRDTWNAVWEAVNRANSVISNVPNIDMDEDDKNRILGEARFLRALHYFNMVRRWGGVPILESETTTSNIQELQVPRNSADEVFTFIIGDLTFALANLPRINTVDVGRASLEAAQALRAKVAIYQEDWGTAESNALAVINDSDRTLVDPYDLWKWSGGSAIENNSESIFEVQYNDVQTHTIQNNFEPRNSGFGPGQWGTITSSIRFYNKFDPADLRRDATYMLEWGSNDDGDSLVQWYEFQVLAAPHIRKYRDADENNASTYNLRVIRLADVMLAASEAIARQSGATAEAYNYVNQVRARAGLPPLAGLAADQLIDSIHLEIRKELCYEGQDFEELVRQNPDPADFVAAKLSYTDYVFGAEPLPPALDDDGNPVVITNADIIFNIEDDQPHSSDMEVDAHNMLFPIPQSALDGNPNLVQNPGYPGGTGG
jgi:hypothetical protein